MGDVDFKTAIEVAAKITPVGGPDFNCLFMFCAAATFFFFAPRLWSCKQVSRYCGLCVDDLWNAGIEGHIVHSEVSSAPVAEHPTVPPLPPQHHTVILLEKAPGGERIQHPIFSRAKRFQYPNDASLAISQPDLFRYSTFVDRTLALSPFRRHYDVKFGRPPGRSQR